MKKISLLIILLCSLFFSKVTSLLWIGFVILEIAIPVIFFLYGNINKARKKEIHEEIIL